MPDELIPETTSTTVTTVDTGTVTEAAVASAENAHEAALAATETAVLLGAQAEQNASDKIAEIAAEAEEEIDELEQEFHSWQNEQTALLSTVRERITTLETLLQDQSQQITTLQAQLIPLKPETTETLTATEAVQPAEIRHENVEGQQEARTEQPAVKRHRLRKI